MSLWWCILCRLSWLQWLSLDEHLNLEAKFLPNGFLFNYFLAIKKCTLKKKIKGEMQWWRKREELVLVSIPNTSIRNINGMKVQSNWSILLAFLFVLKWRETLGGGKWAVWWHETLNKICHVTSLSPPPHCQNPGDAPWEICHVLKSWHKERAGTGCLFLQGQNYSEPTGEPTRVPASQS